MEIRVVTERVAGSESDERPGTVGSVLWRRTREDTIQQRTNEDSDAFIRVRYGTGNAEQWASVIILHGRAWNMFIKNAKYVCYE